MKNKGFTLIELLVAIGIIGVLATITSVSIVAAREKANVGKAKSNIGQIYSAIQTLATETEKWPGNQEEGVVCPSCSGNEICGDGCSANLTASSSGIMSTDGNYPGWGGPYMSIMPIDPWGNEYFFDTDYELDINGEPSGCGGGGAIEAVVVGSYGPDGVGNNQYTCDDIILIIAK